MAVNENYNRFLLRPYMFFIIIFISILSLLPSPLHSMSESEALIKLKQSFTPSNALDSWAPGSPPCNGTTLWTGILCYNGVVTALNMEELGLSGIIDAAALAALDGLRIIDFSNNSFSGPIPELSDLVELRAIYLSNNNFSGDIAPDFFANMKLLKKIWLSNNGFTGEVPYSVSQLSRLVELHLDNNRFSGDVPPLDAVENLVSLDLSGNEFSGELPGVLAARFGTGPFLLNPDLCGESLGRACPAHPKEDLGSKKVIAAAITSCTLIITVAVLLIVRSKKRRGQEKGIEGGKFGREYSNPGESTATSVEVHVSSLNKKEIESIKKINSLTLKGKAGGAGEGSTSGGDMVMVNEERAGFGMGDLMKASAEVLGGSAMGSSYKAVMANGAELVVKRVNKEMNAGGKEHFDTEIRRLGKVRHRNVLSPVAYHFRREEKLVVYEYVPSGSLLYLLHGDHGSTHIEVNWPARLRIAQGIARGLAHIHAELSMLQLPHGNLKSSNVLLGPDFDPLLSDYGFAPLISPAAASQCLFAYASPEASTSGVSPLSDVYCLGVVVLEILTGVFPSQYLGATGKLGGTDVVRMVAECASGDETGLLDPEIVGMKGSVGQMRKLMRLGAACTEADPERRPTVEEASRRIDEIVAVEAMAEAAEGYRPGSTGEHTRFKSGESFPFS